MEFNLEKRVWWEYLEEDLRELLEQSCFLLDLFENRYRTNPDKRAEFHDYSFIVFPAAKAYEGFLKKVFLDLGFITREEYFGKHFRIGRALNPSLEKIIRERESVYDKVTAYCGGRQLADELWETWKRSRNLTFHWFPGEVNAISFDEANSRLQMILQAMDETFKECKIK